MGYIAQRRVYIFITKKKSYRLYYSFLAPSILLKNSPNLKDCNAPLSSNY